MFTRIEFTNFKGFEKLELDGLARVNLVVGKNNSGKTSLLEGIALIANPEQNRIGQLPTLLRSSFGNVNTRFYRWLIRDKSSGAELSASAKSTKSIVTIVPVSNAGLNVPRTFRVGDMQFFRADATPDFNYKVISVHHIEHNQLVQSFGSAMRQKDGEKQLEQLLHAVDVRISRIRVDPAPDGNILVVDIGLSEFIPLEQAGQGVNRLVAIFSELIGGRPQICFIDEIENGIHHSAMTDVWTGIAEAAERIGVQVFATTHSYECIEAAHAAFSKRPNYDFSIVQLFRSKNGVQGRCLDKAQIESALDGKIDLRGI